MVPSLHVQEKNIWPAISVYVGEGCISAPAVGLESDLRRDVLELVVAHILVENRVLEAIGMEMTEKRVF